MGKRLIIVKHIAFTSTCLLYSGDISQGLKLVIFSQFDQIHGILTLQMFSPKREKRLILNEVAKYNPQYL